jgi:L-fuconolactonase
MGCFVTTFLAMTTKEWEKTMAVEMSKRFDGRDEPILEPELPIIDSHHHLFQRPTQGGVRYLLDDYLADAHAGHNIVASVYIEILAFARRHGPEMLRPLGEIEFANGVGAVARSGFYGPCRAAAAIVGYADLRFGDAIGDMLDAAMRLAPERFRGIRQVAMEHPDRGWLNFVTNPPPAGLLTNPEFHKGLRQLADRGLSFDAAVFSVQLPELAKVADAFPEMPFVLNHVGTMLGMGLSAKGRAELLRQAAADMKELARRPNVVCKIGGLGMVQWNFGIDENVLPGRVLGYRELAEVWRPYVEAAIEAFGPERCMMESNFPIDGRTCGFVPLWNALKHITRDYTPEEKAAMYHGTAARIYKIELPEGL